MVHSKKNQINKLICNEKKEIPLAPLLRGSRITGTSNIILRNKLDQFKRKDFTA